MLLRRVVVVYNTTEDMSILGVIQHKEDSQNCRERDGCCQTCCLILKVTATCIEYDVLSACPKWPTQT